MALRGLAPQVKRVMFVRCVGTGGPRMSVRVYIYADTDKRVEELAERYRISKTEVIELAVNNYYRKMVGERVEGV